MILYPEYCKAKRNKMVRIVVAIAASAHNENSRDADCWHRGRNAKNR